MLAEVGAPFILSLGIAGYPGVIRRRGECASKRALLLLLGGLLGLPIAATPGPEQALLDHFGLISEMMSGPVELQLLLLDMTGDGVPEFVLNHSQKCGTGGCGWWVYSPSGPGTVRYLGALDFHPEFFRFVPETRTLVSCWRMGPADCALAKHRVEGREMRLLSSSQCVLGEVACEAELKLIRDWRGRDALPLFVASYEGDHPEPQWRQFRGTPTGAPRLNGLRVK